MYADDIVMFNKSEAGMNLYLKQLEEYCNKWRLTISVKKTKILIINKKTAAVNFKLYNTTLEIVSNYCYLGIMIANSGTFKSAIKYLIKKASNAYFAIRKEINFQNNTSPKVMLRLFDSVIQPVMLYGCEIWGVFGFRKSSTDYLKKYLLNMRHEFETLHTKLCRNILGVHRNATECLVKAELGRFPLISVIVKHVYSYWQHVMNSDPCSLIRNVVLGNTKPRILDYCSRVRLIFETLDCQALLPKVNSTYEIKKNCTKVKLAYQNMYTKYFFDMLKQKVERPQSGGRF